MSAAVGVLARYCSDPTEQHWSGVKRVLRYLKGTISSGLVFHKDSRAIDLIGYSDADWAGDHNDRRSTTGYIFKLAECPISWSSKKQQTVALSTTEAEYMALSAAAQEATWLQQLLLDLRIETAKCVTILEDNQGCIALAKNPVFHSRSKHLDIRHHFVREKLVGGTLKLVYCPSEEMVADILTKPLSNAKFQLLKELIPVG